MTNGADLTMHFDPVGDVLAAARDCEIAIFFDAYGNTATEWQQEYGRYDQSSAFVAITEPGGDAVAVCRMVIPSAFGLKSLDDLSRPPWQVDGYRSALAAGVDPAATIDIATIGVRKGLRGAGMLASLALYHSIVMATRANNLPHIVMIMDERARRLLSMASLTTFVLPGTAPAPYLGSSASTPLWANMAQSMDIQRRDNPEAHRLVGQGQGLAGISIPPLAGFRFRDRLLPAYTAADRELQLGHA